MWTMKESDEEEKMKQLQDEKMTALLVKSLKALAWATSSLWAEKKYMNFIIA